MFVAQPMVFRYRLATLRVTLNWITQAYIVRTPQATVVNWRRSPHSAPGARSRGARRRHRDTYSIFIDMHAGSRFPRGEATMSTLPRLNQQIRS
jgi:hypothetical protein